MYLCVTIPSSIPSYSMHRKCCESKIRGIAKPNSWNASERRRWWVMSSMYRTGWVFWRKTGVVFWWLKYRLIDDRWYLERWWICIWRKRFQDKEKRYKKANKERIIENVAFFVGWFWCAVHFPSLFARCQTWLAHHPPGSLARREGGGRSAKGIDEGGEYQIPKKIHQSWRKSQLCPEMMKVGGMMKYLKCFLHGHLPFCIFILHGFFFACCLKSSFLLLQARKILEDKQEMLQAYQDLNVCDI